MTYEEKKNEAILRLEMYQKKGLVYNVVRKFKKKNPELYYSDRSRIGAMDFGALFYFNELGGAQNKWYYLLKEFEKEYDALVYHVIHDVTKENELLYFLYVSNHSCQWDDEREEIKQDIPFVYACNLTNPLYSEFGNIRCAVRGGGMIAL